MKILQQKNNDWVGGLNCHSMSLRACYNASKASNDMIAGNGRILKVYMFINVSMFIRSFQVYIINFEEWTNNTVIRLIRHGLMPF